jgi:hypothetical protein
MTNPNLSQDQFGAGSHKRVIADMEAAGGYSITPTGIQYEGGTQHEGGMLPVANLRASQYDVSDNPLPNGRSMSKALSFRVPSEDPQVTNDVSLHYEYPRGGKGMGIAEQDAIRLSETHAYPNDEDHPTTFPHYDDDGQATNRMVHASRESYHDNLSSVADHLTRSAQQRGEHLENKTVPGDTFGTGTGGWWHHPAAPDGHFGAEVTPPNSITYADYPMSDDGWEGPNEYQVDTGTRERIPDKDR